MEDTDDLRKIQRVGQKGLRLVPSDLYNLNQARRFGDPRTNAIKLKTEYIVTLMINQEIK